MTCEWLIGYDNSGNQRDAHQKTWFEDEEMEAIQLEEEIEEVDQSGEDTLERQIPEVENENTEGLSAEGNSSSPPNLQEITTAIPPDASDLPSTSNMSRSTRISQRLRSANAEDQVDNEIDNQGGGDGEEEEGEEEEKEEGDNYFSASNREAGHIALR